jgi:hypothetical protein
MPRISAKNRAHALELRNLAVAAIGTVLTITAAIAADLRPPLKRTSDERILCRGLIDPSYCPVIMRIGAPQPWLIERINELTRAREEAARSK